MNRLPFVLLLLLGAPLGCFWALMTVRHRSSLSSGLCKLILGGAILLPPVLEWKASLLVYVMTGLASLTALLGLAEVIAAKVAIDREGHQGAKDSAERGGDR